MNKYVKSMLGCFIGFINVLHCELFADTPPPKLSPIKIGMSSALSGPSGALGQEMKQGIETYFSKINRQGGVNGRPIQLISLDDHYEPHFTALNMHQLLEKDKVLAVIGNVGTPTAVVSIPIIDANKTLLFAPLTGADLLRKTPPDRYIINFRASYAEETASMIKGLLSIGIKPDEMAFFVQNDAYGDSGYNGAMKALKEIGYSNPEHLPVGRYERNTLNVEEGLSQIMSYTRAPKSIIMVGTYAPNAKFILLASKYFPHTLFLNVSFVGSIALSKALNGKGNNQVIVTQIVPHFQSNLPAMKEYLDDLKQYAPHATPDFGSLEGYLTAKLFVKALQLAADQNKLTREGIIDAFEQMHDVDIGIGKLIRFSPSEHHALHAVWPTILRDGRFVPFEWSQLKAQDAGTQKKK